jgi:hypothetical protein
MYAHEFVQCALKAMRACTTAAKERMYEQLRTQLSQCAAHVVMNGKTFKYGVVHKGDPAATCERLQAGYGGDLAALNKDLSTSFKVWDDVRAAAATDLLTSIFQTNLNALDSVLQQVRSPDQHDVHVALEAMHKSIENEFDIDTCYWECEACDGNTVEAHFACLAARNPRIRTEEWYTMLLGYLLHSVNTGIFLPYYNHSAQVPAADALHVVLAAIGDTEWNLENDAQVIQKLRDVWAMPAACIARTPADVLSLLPPTSCYTLALFHDMMQQRTCTQNAV